MLHMSTRERQTVPGNAKNASSLQRAPKGTLKPHSVSF